MTSLWQESKTLPKRLLTEYIASTLTLKAESTFVASFKASEVFVDVKVAVQINFTNYQGLEVGGKLYIVDEHGDQLAEENYLTPSEGELNQGINYQVRTYTDQVFYLWAEANSGYSFSLSVEKGAATIDQITASGKTIYKISQAQNLSLLQGVFRAEEQRVEVSFVTVAEEGKNHRRSCWKNFDGRNSIFFSNKP